MTVLFTIGIAIATAALVAALILYGGTAAALVLTGMCGGYVVGSFDASRGFK